jgi:hypothetical protein
MVSIMDWLYGPVSSLLAVVCKQKEVASSNLVQAQTSKCWKRVKFNLWSEPEQRDQDLGLQV